MKLRITMIILYLVKEKKQAWDDNILEFITLSNKYDEQMILIGAGAVNFNGYQCY